MFGTSALGVPAHGAAAHPVRKTLTSHNMRVPQQVLLHPMQWSLANRLSNSRLLQNSYCHVRVKQPTGGVSMCCQMFHNLVVLRSILL